MTDITLAPVQPDQPIHLMATYGRQAISFVRGRGAYLYTQDGTEYLDALTGIAVCGLGTLIQLLQRLLQNKQLHLCIRVICLKFLGKLRLLKSLLKFQVWKKFSFQTVAPSQ